MKSIPIKVSLLLTLLASACHVPYAEKENGSDNMWVGEAMRRAQVEAAIVVQQVVQPYHFVTESAELNELGELELGVMAAHYMATPGSLSVRRGGAAEALYQARVASVTAFLGAAGVEPEGVAITDSWPGGAGMPSTRVNEVLAASRLQSGPAGAEPIKTGDRE